MENGDLVFFYFYIYFFFSFKYPGKGASCTSNEHDMQKYLWFTSETAVMANQLKLLAINDLIKLYFTLNHIDLFLSLLSIIYQHLINKIIKGKYVVYAIRK